MQKRTREIIALALLAVFLVVGACAFGLYILVGHNWNVTASNIDDHFGQLDQYTIVLVEGSASHAVEDDGEKADKLVNQRVQEAGEQAEKTENDERADAASTTENNSPSSASADGGRTSTLLREGPALLERADAAYVEKGAQTITGRPSDIEFYADPVIVPRNGKRVAIYTVSGPLADVQSRFALLRLAPYSIDSSICIIDNASALKRGIGNASIAICTDPKERIDDGYIDGTYAISTPYISQVAAVLVAPSGFISSKILSGL